jgi:hypothetical protein
MAGIQSCTNNFFAGSSKSLLGIRLHKPYSYLWGFSIYVSLSPISFQTQELKGNTFPGSYLPSVASYFLPDPFLIAPSSFSWTLNMYLGIIGFVRSIYKLLSVCLLSFNFTWAILIFFVNTKSHKSVVVWCDQYDCNLYESVFKFHLIFIMLQSMHCYSPFHRWSLDGQNCNARLSLLEPNGNQICVTSTVPHWLLNLWLPFGTALEISPI